MTVMPTTPATRATTAERNEGRSEAAGNSFRFMTRNPRTPSDSSDSSTSPPRARCSTTLMARTTGDDAGAALAPAHAPGQGQEPDADQGHQRPGRLGGDEGEQFEDQVEAAPQGWGDRREQRR